MLTFALSRHPALNMETSTSSRTLRFGVFEVDLRAAELRKQGIKIRLQEQPFQLLALLLEHPGVLVTREELRRKLWSADTLVDFDRNLNKAMNKLRIALSDSAETPRFIETLHRRGYRFIAPVQAEEPFPALPSVELSSLGTSRPFASLEVTKSEMLPASASELPAKRVGPPYALAGVTVLAMCFVAVLYLRQHSGPNTSPLVSPRRSIAVLGFKNLSGRSDERWVSTALADWLTTELAAGEQLRTIPGESVARSRIELSLPDLEGLGKDNLSRIGKNLGTDLVVIGSYASLGKESGDQVRLDLRLIDTRSGDTIDAISETGTELRLFDLVSRAGQHLRSKLGVEAVTREQAAEVAFTLPSNHDAARFYSEGLEKLRVFDALAARQSFAKAIALEPKYALAYSALATAWAALGYDENASAEAKKAFELSFQLPRPERLLIEGRYRGMSKDWTKAIEIYRALFEFFPDSLDYGLALADAQVNGGKGRDAEDTVDALRKLPEPLGDDPRIDLADARAAESLGDFRRDLTAATKAAEKAHTLGALLLRAQARADQAWALENLGRFDDATIAANEAKHLYEQAGDKRGVARAINYTGIALQYKGDPSAAKQKYEEALAIYREIGYQWGAANELDDLGDVLLSLGDLNGSGNRYEQSMATYQEIGHEDGVALTKGALGAVLLARGDHEGAKRTCGESVEICRRIGDRAKSAIAMNCLARAVRVEGDLQTASQYESDALNEFTEIGEKLSTARSQLALAELALDQGKAADAVVMAREAAEEFDKEKAATDQALASAVLSQALLGQGKTSEANRSIERAEAILRESHDRRAELLVAIAAARVRAASRDPRSRRDAARSLEQVIRDTRRIGFLNYEFEARLALGELEISSSDTNGREYLEGLQKEAAAKGFQLIAKKASEALGAVQRTSK